MYIIILCVAILHGFCDGLVCDLDNCLRYNNDDRTYQGKKGLLINGILDENCRTGTNISIISENIVNNNSFKAIFIAKFNNSGMSISYTLQVVVPITFVDNKFIRLKSMAINIITVQNINDSSNWFKIYNNDANESSLLQMGTDKTYIHSSKLLREKNITFTGSQTIKIEPIECSKSLSVSFCDCSEPVITDLFFNSSDMNNRTSLICEGSGYPVGELTVSWFTNGTFINNALTEQERNTSLDTIISKVRNISITEFPTKFACEIRNMVTKKTTSKNIIVQTEREEEQVSGDEITSIITIIISVLAAALLMIIMISIGVITLVRCHATRRKHAISMNFVPDNHKCSSYDVSDSDSDYDDEFCLESVYSTENDSIDDTVEIPKEDNDGPNKEFADGVIYSKPIKEYKEESIFNRLDPKTMTTRRSSPNTKTKRRRGHCTMLPQSTGLVMSNPQTVQLLPNHAATLMASRHLELASPGRVYEETVVVGKCPNPSWI